MAKNILIRDLTEDQQNTLNRLRTKFYEKTNSKVIERLLKEFPRMSEQISDLQERNLKLQKQNDLLKAFASNIHYEFDLLETGDNSLKF